ncbi:MAG: hypothetical protein M3P91_07185 [Actinomycetota bacterium]|nr:hypothetical protein [Actinomycetota bacterium]
MHRPFLAGISAVLVTAGCAGGSGNSRPAAEPASPASPSSAVSAGPSTPAPLPSSSPGTVPAEDVRADSGPSGATFRADTRADVEETTGNGLSVTDVRVGNHAGFDRVVWEFGGTGRPGWNVRYTDDPRRQGSGDPVDLAGGATLEVYLTGVGYPTDTGVKEYGGPRRFVTGGTAAVTEVAIGGVFEGRFDAFVGVEDEAPFRVYRLDAPARVVLEIRT